MFKVFDLLNGARMTPQYAEVALANGVQAAHITLNNFKGINPVPDLRHSLQQLADYRIHLRSMSSLVHVVETFEDFERAANAGKLAIVLGYQNVPGVARDLKLLELFHSLGVRVLQVAHNVRNLYGDGCAEPANAGLSTLGQELVAVMDGLGLVIDLSHVGEQTGLDVVALSKNPVTATHANCYSVCPNARNKSDALMDAMAAKGGVLGITYLPPLVLMPGQIPNVSDVVSHITYAVNRIGVDHVGIGSDFITDQPAERYEEFMKKPEVYGTWPWRFPINTVQEQQEMLSSLEFIGLNAQQIQAVARDNFMRVFKAILK